MVVRRDIAATKSKSTLAANEREWGMGMCVGSREASWDAKQLEVSATEIANSHKENQLSTAGTLECSTRLVFPLCYFVTLIWSMEFAQKKSKESGRRDTETRRKAKDEKVGTDGRSHLRLSAIPEVAEKYRSSAADQKIEDMARAFSRLMEKNSGALKCAGAEAQSFAGLSGTAKAEP